ncbi:hypothetical protein N7528_009944 [Penicillium herquei]|nr:hypothetical protein N7528_009944 [Penicillium herquei]
MSQLDDLQNRDLAEEIEAINAIYEPDTIVLDPTGTTSSKDDAPTTITLRLPGQPHLSFIISFDAKYPDTRPRILGTASTAARGGGKNCSAVCLFDVISEAVEVFPELNIGGNKDSPAEESESTANQALPSGEPHSTTAHTAESFARLSLKDSVGLDNPPDWILSDIVTEKKSVFLARAVQVSTLAEAQAYLDYLTATDKKVAVATHNISAWRIKQKREGASVGSDAAETQIQDYDDDGETAAGGRLLHVMQLMDVWNVLVVVSRWYGGIHLGPARFRFINDVGRDALVKGGFVRGENSAGSDKGKKKGKK